jgi:crotonobetainyl-CoA:carnitine CoA-transferase CaiB-like acyl-CoA transferase
MLEPYRVLDLSDERGLLCGQMLADLGADVISVEPPGGNPARRLGPFADDIVHPERSLVWWSLARNRRSITLDIARDEGRALFLRLVRTADFVIESFEPGYLARLGLGYADLAEVNPRIILVSITAFGQDGPKANWPATDLTVMAASGALIMAGDADRAPVQCAVPQGFLHAAAEGAVGALLAHHARERDGIGQHVDVSAQTAAMMTTQSMILQHGWGEQEVTRMAGGTSLGPFKVRLIYPCADGYVSVTFLFGSGLGPFTRRLMEWMCEEGFVDEATRDKDWIGYLPLVLSGQEPMSEYERCTAAIETFTRTKTKAELTAGAQQRGCLIAPVNTVADLLESRQLLARDFWVPLDHPELGRAVTYPGPFVKFSATPIQYRRRPPLVGEHNAEVYGELGLGLQDLVGLFAAGTI